MAEQIDRSAALIERLLGEPELRRRFLADPASVLREQGLSELATDLGHGQRALMTLELRESRSSLAGVMVAAAAEAVDLAHVVERATPGMLHDAAQAVQSVGSRGAGHAHPTGHPGGGARPAPAAGPVARAPGGLAPLAAPSPATRYAAPPAAPGANARVDHHAPQPVAGVLDTPPTDHPDPLAYPGDTATPQQLAAWMGVHAVKAGLPAELPVIAALTESGLRNLNYGDRDSVGFFQMRLGIWNEGPYVGYPSNPQLQIQWFIDHALAVKAQYPGLAENPASWGELVANVEQPAAEYRYRYQLQLATAQALLRGADLTPAPPAPPVPLGQAALKVALTQLQTTGGGAPPASGFDGAGLVQFAFAHEGVELPRVAAEQYDVGIPVGRDQLKLGDAVFFKDGTGFVHQVGLYVGGGRFVTAPDQTGHVRISALSEPRFAATYAGARRFTLGALGDPKSYARSMPTVGS